MKNIICTIILSFLLRPTFGQLSIGANINLASNGNISIVLKDMDLVNNGTTVGGFKFTGSQNSTISGSSSPNFSILELGKNNNAKLLLDQQIHVSTSVNFISGLLDLNYNNIILDATAYLAGESETSRIIGESGGYVEIKQDLAAPYMANPGNLGAIITSNANLGSTTIRRGHAIMGGAGLTSSISRNYYVTPSNNDNLEATIRLKYFDAELNGQTEEQLVIWQFNPLYDGANWRNLSHSGRDATSNYVQRAGITNLYLQTLANDNLISTDSRTMSVRSLPSKTTFIQKKITVGPNPNNGNFWFSVNGIEKETIGTLYSIDGKQIQKFRIVNLQQQKVDGIRTGIYLLKVPGFETQKIIVNSGGNSAPLQRQTIADNPKL